MGVVELIIARPKPASLGGHDELVGPHVLIAPSEPHFPEISHHQLTEILFLEQAAHRLCDEDLPAFGGVTELDTAKHRPPDPADPCRSRMKRDAHRESTPVRPLMGCEGAL